MLGLLKAYRAELFFLLFLGLIYCIFSATFELNSYTELPLYETAREMLDGESWHLPTIQHGLISPLMLSLVALSLKLFGVSVEMARLPAILLSMLGLLLTYIFCVVTIRSRTTALLSAITLGTSLGFFGLAPLSASGILIMDTLLFTLISFQVWRNQLGKRKANPGELHRACGLLGLSTVLLFLSQGWFAIVWAAITIFLFLGFSHGASFNRMQGGWSWPGFLIGLGIPSALSLFVVSLLPKGWDALGQFVLNAGFGEWAFFQNNVLLDGVTLLFGLFPYVFFLGAFIWEWFRLRRNAGPSHLGKEPLILLSCWLGISILASWIFAPAHSVVFLLPCMAPLACFIGSYAARFFDGEEATNAYNWSMELTIIAIGILAVLISIFIFNTLSETHPVEFWRFPGPAVIEKIHLIKDIPLDPPFPVWKLWLTPGPFILLITAIVLYILHTMRRSRQAGMMLMIFWLVFLLFMKTLFMPVLQRPVHRQNADTLQALIKPGTTLWVDGTQGELLATFFYMNVTDKDQPIRISNDPSKDLTQWIQSPMYHRMIGVIPEAYYYALDSDVRSNLRILNHRWKWILLNPSHVLQLFNADYMQTLTYNTLVFETLPPDTPLNLEQVSEDDQKKK